MEQQLNNNNNNIYRVYKEIIQMIEESEQEKLQNVKLYSENKRDKYT